MPTRKTALAALASLAAVAAALCDEASAKTKSFEGEDYKLVFSEEFDGTALDKDLWTWRASGWSRGWGRGHFWVKEEGTWLDSEGNLVLSFFSKERENLMKELDPRTAEDVGRCEDRWIPCTEMLRTKFELVYGYHEIRARLPIVKGAGFAYWLQSSRIGDKAYIKTPPDPANAGAEIDVVEQTFFDANGAPNDYKHSTIHWNGYGPEHNFITIDVGRPSSASKELDKDIISDIGSAASKSVVRRAIAHESELSLRDGGYHVFGVLWTESGYSFYYDGELIGSIQEGVSKTPQIAILQPRTFSWSKLRGNAKEGLGDAKSTQAKYLVDYYRVYMNESQRNANRKTISSLPAGKAFPDGKE